MSSTFALLFELLCARDDFWHHGYSNRLRRLDDDDDMSDIVTTASFIGIIVAISGNMLISLALNCQKLAHRRLEREREAHSKEVGRSRKEQRPLLGERRLSIASEHHIAEEPSEHEDMNDEQDEEDDDHTRVGELSQHQSPDSDLESNYGELIPFPGQSTPSRSHQTFRDRAHSLLLETEPLLIVSAGTSPRGSVRGGYGSRDSSIPSGGSPRAKIRTRPSLLSRLFSHGTKGKQKAMTTEVTKVAAIPADIRANGSSNGTREDSSSNRQRQRLTFAEPANGSGSNSGVDEANESDYLKSKLWWLGFLLMVIGEMGNFISYAFAPASVVAPLGTFALIANCFFAPIMLKEKFRKRDLLGVGLSILGAVTVVLSANPSDVRLDPNSLIRALTQRPFIFMAVIYVVGVISLVGLSSQQIGSEYVYIDVGACALFGGFTVLSTKAFSSLLTLEWVAIFKEWITYPVLAVLIGTGIGQIRYLNRALMKFDSKVVIPTQFVLFNLSAIIGSAVLYGDFRKASLHQLVTFLYGCGTTFAGVFMLTWGSNVEREGSEAGSHVEERESDRERAERTGRAQVVLPSTPLRGARATPILRAKTSSMSLMGLSPAQRVLLTLPSTASSPPKGAGQ